MNIDRHFRPTWVEIDLDALAYNYRQLKKFIAADVKILAAVKADAYGHGAIEVSRFLAELGVDMLGVATTDEAMELRRHNIKMPILILGVVYSEREIIAAIKNQIIPTVPDWQTAFKINRAAAQFKKRVKVHLKIDTGMGRIGVWHAQARALAKKISNLPWLEVEGLYTHLSSADCDRRFTREQIMAFNNLATELAREGMKIEFRHAANSIAVCDFPEAHFNLVRPGIMLYGMYPHSRLEDKIRLKPVMALKTRVSFLKKVAAHQPISYGQTFITKKSSIVATLPIGYADGYCRLLSNKGRALVKGRFAKVRGRICMDQTMIDLTNIKGVRLWEEVVLIGKARNRRITAAELATICQTIPYEISCGISPRVPRLYKQKSVSGK